MGRISIREGVPADEPGVARLDPVPIAAATEDEIRRAFDAALGAAGAGGARVVALAVDTSGPLPLQRRAEVLFEAARRHLAGTTPIEELRFFVEGEPGYRVFEAVQDAARIAEQMERLRGR